VEEPTHETDQQRRRTEWRSVRRLFPNRRPQQMAFCSAVAQQRFCSAFCWAAACSDDGSARPSLATELGSLCPPPSSIGLACSPHTLVLVFACVMVLGALLYSLFAWFFSSCAVRTRRAFLPVALCRLPISLAQTKRACPLPPHSLVRFVCICVFRLSLRGELGYSSSHRRLH